MPKSKRAPAAGKVLDNSELADVFGIEMDSSPQPTKPASPRKKAAPVKTAVKKAGKTAKATLTAKRPAKSAARKAK